MKWIFAFAAVFSSIIIGADCSHFWRSVLDTNPLHPKGLSGDTAAAYGLMAFRADSNTKLVFEGKYPTSRFMSFEGYRGRLQRSVGSILDFNIEPEAGSLNPFRDREMPNNPRQYRVEVLPPGGTSQHPNVIRLDHNRGLYSFFYRVYVPAADYEMTTDKLPKILAYDLQTGKPKSCPEMVELPFYLNFPQLVANIMAGERNAIELKDKNVNIGSNVAIPYYLYGLNLIDFGKVLVFRFRAPSFPGAFNDIPAANTDVRYWSFCFQNFVRNETLNCLPDFKAVSDSSGEVTLVYGGSSQVALAASERGFNYLPDTRDSKQWALGYAYRNLLPSSRFQESSMYRDEYRPRGVVCSENEFLSGNCSLD